MSTRRSRPQPLDLTSINNFNNLSQMSNFIAVASSPLFQQAAAQLSNNLMRQHYQPQNSPFLQTALLSVISPTLSQNPLSI